MLQAALDYSWEWLSKNWDGLLAAVATGLVLALFKKVRQWVWLNAKAVAGWVRAVVLSIPNHLALRGHVIADKPLWSFRKSGGISLDRAPLTLTIMNFKGGVGKTTLAANLAAAFATSYGLRVLLVDLDYQGSLTDLLSRTDNPENKRNLVSRWLSAPTLPTSFDELAVSIKTPDGNPAATGIKLVTADYGLTDTEDSQMLRWLLNEGTKGDVRSRVARMLTNPQLDLRNHFDLVIMDAPPRLSLASANALRATRYIIIPSKLQPLSALPVAKMFNYLDTVKKRVGAKFQVAGVVCNMTQGATARGTETQALAEITRAVDALAARPNQAPRGQDAVSPVVYTKFIPDLANIGRPPAGVPIGYFLSGKEGQEVRAIFDPLAAEIAEQIGIARPVAKAAE